MGLPIVDRRVRNQISADWTRGDVRPARELLTYL